MKQKGFAISGILYSILILFLALILGIMTTLAKQKVLLDKIKLEVSQRLNQIQKDKPVTPEVPVINEYVDSSGANKPEMLENMIPIKYNGTNWIYADIEQEWYSYNESDKKWANAVVLKSDTYKQQGNIINEDDVVLWYVWIPRYKYKLFNANNGVVNEQVIEINFESGTETTGTVECTTITSGSDSTSSETCTGATNGAWYTHPAFTLGEQELTGIWVGKFEISTSDSACYDSSTDDELAANCTKVLPVTIKPNVKSWRYGYVSTFYQAIQNISDLYNLKDTDSHMIKNMEWGAVAYFKQSKYGLGTTDIAINNTARNFLTGDGNYKANVNQSTTGNIYGIYDMNGGTHEYVMANQVNPSNAFFSQSANFTEPPDSKYYDAYSYGTNNLNIARGKLGDATKEVIKTSNTNQGIWYNDLGLFTFSGSPWMVRGGNTTWGSGAGIFHFSYNGGVRYNDTTTRAVLTKK